LKPTAQNGGCYGGIKVLSKKEPEQLAAIQWAYYA
jgi:hypothetical protein